MRGQPGIYSISVTLIGDRAEVEWDPSAYDVLFRVCQFSVVLMLARLQKSLK